jgi:biopolymer transport protein ExbD
MQKIEFRRNHANKRSGPISKRSIIIAIALFIIFGIIVTLLPAKKEIKELSIINVTFLQHNQYKINNDTTNFENFASVLKEKIQKFKRDNLELRLFLPKDKKMEELSDIIQIANAFDVEMKLLAE